MLDILKITPHVVSKDTTGKCYLFYGEPGTYKTTVACGFPNSLLCAVDVGYAFIDGVRPVTIDSWATWKGVQRQLKQAEAKKQYKNIIIDGVGLLFEMCERYICNREQVDKIGDIAYGGGYAMMRKEFSESMYSLVQNGFGIVFISHADVKEDENENVTIKPKLSKSALETIYGLVDFIFYCRKEAKEGSVDITTTYAYCNTPANIITKSRLRNLPNKFEFTYANLNHALQNGVEELESQGVVVAEQTTNLYESAKMPLADLKTEIVTLATPLLENAATTGEANAIISNSISVRISEATQGHYESLEVIYQELLDLKEKYGL